MARLLGKPIKVHFVFSYLYFSSWGISCCFVNGVNEIDIVIVLFKR
jgi:hypothetical protein